MGLMSKLKHHVKKLIGKPEEVAERVADHVEKEEKKIKSTPKKYTNLRQKKQRLKQKVLLKRLKRNKGSYQYANFSRI
jgi:arginyl-tRNA synthetase